jgi:hypothetical protein
MPDRVPFNQDQPVPRSWQRRVLWTISVVAGIAVLIVAYPGLVKVDRPATIGEAVLNDDFDRAVELATRKLEDTFQIPEPSRRDAAQRDALKLLAKLTYAEGRRAQFLRYSARLHRRLERSGSRQADHDLQLQRVISKMVAGIDSATREQLRQAKRYELQAVYHDQAGQPRQALRKLQRAGTLYDNVFGAGNLMSTLNAPLDLEIRLRHFQVDDPLGEVAAIESGLRRFLDTGHDRVFGLQLLRSLHFGQRGQWSKQIEALDQFLLQASEGLDVDDPRVRQARNSRQQASRLLAAIP